MCRGPSTSCTAFHFASSESPSNGSLAKCATCETSIPFLLREFGKENGRMAEIFDSVWAPFALGGEAELEIDV